ncbi:heavy metal translocating P-type ATPase [Salinirarus marinus]|uniref:heavy metal translocating P-type ATPase n=1 Tax=Salinirarus marinus TaxID=3068310 RepID=UPI003C6CB771
MEGTDTDCRLCGLPAPGDRITNDAGESFCCVGCRDVHAALDDAAGVDESDLRGGSTDAGRDADAPPPAGHERAFLRVDGMHCTTCESFVESLAMSHDGVSRAESSYVTETVRVDYDPDRVTEDELPELLSAAGYTASRRDDALGRERPDDDVLWRLVGGVMLGMMVMLPYVIYIYPLHFGLYPEWMLELVRAQLADGSYFFYLLFVFTSLVVAYTGAPILRGAAVSLRSRQPNMDLLIAVAAVSAYLYSTLAVALGRIDVYYDVTVAIVVVVTAGRYYESSTKRRATDLLSTVQSAQVERAHRYRDDGSTVDVSPDELDASDRVLVREGDRIPVDGTVWDGECTVNEAVVTGESLPVGKREGDEVIGGSVVTDGAAVVMVGEGATSSVDRIADLVWNLQSTSHGIQKLADRLATVFVPSVLALAVLVGGAYFLTGAGVARALLVALTVLLVSCPCALGLATPLAVASGVREALERGVVVFDDTVFERLRTVDVVAFDKTGTLTTGALSVRDVDAPEDLRAAAAAVERRSAHPVAEAVVAAFGDERVSADGGPVGEEAKHAQPTDFRSHQRGVEGVVDDETVLVGHPDLFADRGWTLPVSLADRAATARDAGHLPVVLGRDGRAEGLVVLGDDPREGWAETVQALSDRGMDVVLLTGDDDTATSEFRDHPAIDRVFAGVPPEAKAETVRRLGADGSVAMIGDGTNDGPALASADLGIALGGGTALAVDAADVAVVDDDLASVGTVFDLASATGRRIRRNVGWAFLYNGVAVPLAVVGLLNPLFATVAMASSSLLVVANSSRDLLDAT